MPLRFILFAVVTTVFVNSEARSLRQSSTPKYVETPSQDAVDEERVNYIKTVYANAELAAQAAARVQKVDDIPLTKKEKIQLWFNKLFLPKRHDNEKFEYSNDHFRVVKILKPPNQ
ncbi:RxLR effector protein [Phytophthora megakarya]|uniref:RxLR effector protein n=1 Tax=Phytophthora megakarya TaxID=4795 RepID=A0A225WYA2_9STRA|nr:RxLR effector protein [Phytophthora megakarya]